MFDVNFRDATLDDVIELLTQSGYEFGGDDFDFARDNEFFKFIGVAEGRARYLVAFESAENEDLMYASVILVGLYNVGFTADWSAAPPHEVFSVEEMTKYFEDRCN